MSLNNIDLSQFLGGFYKLFVQLEPFDGYLLLQCQKKKEKKPTKKGVEVECSNLKDLTKVICYVEGKTS